VKQIHAEILSEEDEILMKKLATMYRVKNASLIDNKLIQKCYKSCVDEHLEIKRIKNFIK